MPAMPTVSASGVTADASRRACERVLATARNPPAPDNLPTGAKQSKAGADQQRCEQSHRQHRGGKQPERHGGSERTADRLGGEEQGAGAGDRQRSHDAANHAQPSRRGGRGGEGFDRSHLPGATTGEVRRDLTRQHSGADGDDDRDPTGIDLERPGQQTAPLHGVGQPRREPQTGPHPERCSQHRHDQRLPRDHPANLARRGAHRSQQGDLSLPLLHEQRQHACDHQHGDEQSDAAQRAADRDQPNVRLSGVDELGATSLVSREHRDVVTECPPHGVGHLGEVGVRREFHPEQIDLTGVAVETLGVLLREEDRRLLPQRQAGLRRRDTDHRGIDRDAGGHDAGRATDRDAGTFGEPGVDDDLVILHRPTSRRERKRCDCRTGPRVPERRAVGGSCELRAVGQNQRGWERALGYDGVDARDRSDPCCHVDGSRTRSVASLRTDSRSSPDPRISVIDWSPATTIVAPVRRSGGTAPRTPASSSAPVAVIKVTAAATVVSTPRKLTHRARRVGIARNSIAQPSSRVMRSATTSAVGLTM